MMLILVFIIRANKVIEFRLSITEKEFTLGLDSDAQNMSVIQILF